VAVFDFSATGREMAKGQEKTRNKKAPLIASAAALTTALKQIGTWNRASIERGVCCQKSV